MKGISVLFALLFNALLSVASGSPLAAQQPAAGDSDPADQAIVDHLFPVELTKDKDADLDKESCFARLDRQTIVAAYSYGFSSALFLLRDDGQNGYIRKFKVQDLGLTGGRCEVDLIHLWDDAHVRHPGQHPQQVTVGFSTAGPNMIEWAFDVVVDKLVNISPPSSEVSDTGEFETALTDYDLVNYDHDGTMQLISGGEYPPPADGSGPESGMSLYRIRDHRIVLDPAVSVIHDATINQNDLTGAPNFLKPTSLSGPFILRMVNGDWHGENRVHSAFVSLNGKVVASFNQADDIVEINVPLKEGNNVIAVEAAPEGSQQMTLAIVQKIAPTTSAQ